MAGMLQALRLHGGPSWQCLQGLLPPASLPQVEAMSKGERNDLIARQAKRMELARSKALYGYFNDGSGWQGRPVWQSSQQLFAAQAKKTPWQAAWDRLGRIIYR